MIRFLAFALFALVACGDDGSPTDSGATDGAPVADAPSGEQCDPKLVSCRALPPDCPPMFVPSIDGACWGLCVQGVDCAPIPCDEMASTPQCPAGWGCLASTCRPPRM